MKIMIGARISETRAILRVKNTTKATKKIIAKYFELKVAWKD